MLFSSVIKFIGIWSSSLLNCFWVNFDFSFRNACWILFSFAAVELIPNCWNCWVLSIDKYLSISTVLWSDTTPLPLSCFKMKRSLFLCKLSIIVRYLQDTSIWLYFSQVWRNLIFNAMVSWYHISLKCFDKVFQTW